MPPSADDADNPLRILKTAPMPLDPRRFLQRFGIAELVGAFGMTEVGSVLTWRGSDAPKPGLAGHPRRGVELRIVDEHDVPVAVGSVGELVLRCDRPWEVSVGYLGDPAATATAWRNGWFHTGDAFRADADGDYFFVDRLKDSLRRRGENISSFDVEREVMTHPSVVDAACVPYPGELGDDEVKVFVVAGSAGLDPEELIGFLAERMAYFMVPRYLEVIAELPKTPSGRTEKHELRALGNSAATWDREQSHVVVGRDR